MAFWATPLTPGSGDPKRKYRFTNINFKCKVYLIEEFYLEQERL